MTERPIIFSSPMVRAILAGRKTQTRRVIKPALGPEAVWAPWEGIGTWKAQGLLGDIPIEARAKILYSPYGVSGDRLWVRETWFQDEYIASKPIYYLADESGGRRGRWKPSIHMPRWASRLTLEVVNVRVERAQGISADDAIAEGVPKRARSAAFPWSVYAREDYQSLWNSLNAKRGYGWDKNPLVWVIEFKRT